jgi:hypothetical protein
MTLMVLISKNINKMNKRTEELFNLWTNRDSWSSGHNLDDQRFYDFVHSAYADGITASEFSDVLDTKVHKEYASWTAESKDEKTNKFTSRFEELTTFLKHIEYTE